MDFKRILKENFLFALYSPNLAELRPVYALSKPKNTGKYRTLHLTPLAIRAGRNSSPSRHVGSRGKFATLIPISIPNRA